MSDYEEELNAELVSWQLEDFSDIMYDNASDYYEQEELNDY